MQRVALVAALLFVPVGPAVAGPPSTASMDGWRAADLDSGWRADAQQQSLRFDSRWSGSLVSADPVWESRAEISLRILETYDPAARIALRFRSSGDERTCCAAVVEPVRRRLVFERVVDNRPDPEHARVVELPPVEPGKSYRLGYRIENRRAVLCFEGRDLITLDGVVPPESGRIGLAASAMRADIAQLDVQVGRPSFTDSFRTLEHWKPYYGPEAWTAAPEGVAVFSAAADGGIAGDQQWTNFTVQVKGKFVETSNRWACFGVRPKIAPDNRSFYVVEVRGQQNRLVVWKQYEGARDKTVAREIKLPAIETGRWYTLLCRFEGDRVQVELDGRRYVDLRDARPIPVGRTALSASHGTIQFDDFRQEELESDYRFAAKQPPLEPYDAGPGLAEPGAVGKDDAAYWYLSGKDLRAAIDKKTGMVGGLFVPSEKRLVVRRMVNLYKLETRSSEVRSDAYGDVVERVVDRTDGQVVLQCANRSMPGVAIEKRFALDERGEKLIETVAFANKTDRPDVFITLAGRTVLDEGFRRRAIYTGGSYFGPLVPAESIRQRVLTDAFKNPWVRGITNGRPSWILALNHERNRHLASYRYRVNGQYVLPWNSIWTEELNNLYHTPVGWEMGVATLHLKPGEQRSAEVHHRFFCGSRLDFYQYYMDLPEVAEMYARVGPRPGWLADLKMPIWVPNAHKMRLTEEGYLVWLMHPFSVWGDMPTSGTVRTAGGIARWPVERLRSLIEKDQSVSPRIKAGFYTWAWSARQCAEVVAQHPEWFIARDKAGKIRNAYPLPLSFLRCLSAPGCLEATVKNYHDIVRYYGEDFQYLDNDGTGVQIIDWEHLQLDQDYDWQRLHEGLLAAARARSAESATFYNNRILPQGDISFAEFMTDEIQNAEWRRPANEMWPLKVFQKRDPDRVIALLYWRGENLPGYTNYSVGLGLTPWGGTLGQLPFVNAAFETRRLEIMDADLAPDWQRDLKTNIEAYTLRQGNAAMIFLVGHEPTPVETELAFDSRRIGLQPGKPYFAWQFELADGREHVGRLTERQQREAYEAANWHEEGVVEGQFLAAGPKLAPRYARRMVARPERLRMLMLTHSPAVVWSINGRRTNFWLPTLRHIECRGNYDPGKQVSQIECRCGEERAELAVFVPAGKRVVEATLGGKPVDFAPELAGGAWFARIAVGKGDHRVVVRYETVEPPKVTRLEIDAPSTVRAGESVPVRVEGLPADVQQASLLRVLQGQALVCSLAGDGVSADGTARFVVKVPETARPATYHLAFNPLGSADSGPRAHLRVEPGSWKQPPPPTVKRGAPVIKRWDVHRKINGLDVLRAATETFDHRGGVQVAALDTNTLRAECGLPETSESPWGYGFAGVEVEGAKKIAVDLRHNFFEPHRDGFEVSRECPDSLVGFVVDYHTAQGYTHRVVLGLGIMENPRPVATPRWGKSAQPDRCVDFSHTILEKPQDELTVDLDSFAPADWDGRVWFGVGLDTVHLGLKLQAAISGSSESRLGRQAN